MLSLIILVLGIVMTAAPKACTKKEMRDDPAAVKKIRTSGIILICCAIALEVLFLLLPR